VTGAPAAAEGRALLIHLAAMRAALGPLPVAAEESPDAGAFRLWPSRSGHDGPEGSGGRLPRDESVEAAVLRWEGDYWWRSAQQAGLTLSPAALREAVAAAALFGAGNQGEADLVLAALPGLAHQPAAVRPVGAWLGTLYSGAPAGGWQPLQPERLAEHLIATEILESAAFREFVAGHAPRVFERQQRRMLIVLAQAAARHPQLDGVVSDLVVRLVTPHLPRAALVAEVAAGLRRPDPLLAGFAMLLDVLPLAQLPDLFEATPRYPRLFARWAADLVGRLPAGPDPSPVLAPLYADLSTWLTTAGLRDEGVTAGRTAVEQYRRLVTAGNDEFVAPLASALTSLCARLGELDREPEAVLVAQEAVRLRRGLAAGGGDDFRPDLALSLHILAVRLMEAHRPDEGREAAEEAVRRYRQLVPAANSGLASSLLTFGICLGKLGHQEPALAAVKEAVSIRRALVEKEPTATAVAGLACALSSLSARYDKLGKPAEGQPAAAEAVRQYRDLATMRWDEFAPGLACALSNLGALLGKLGHRSEGAEVALEAVTIRRELARQRPRTVEPMLAKSLGTYGWLLAEQGKVVDAVQPLAEAWSLAQQHGSGIGDFVRTQLEAAYAKAPADVAAAWRRATGQEWPPR
jgi:tetratricopeptide (TPR) repeat protein